MQVVETLGWRHWRQSLAIGLPCTCVWAQSLIEFELWPPVSTDGQSTSVRRSSARATGLHASINTTTHTCVRKSYYNRWNIPSSSDGCCFLFFVYVECWGICEFDWRQSLESSRSARSCRQWTISVLLPGCCRHRLPLYCSSRAKWHSADRTIPPSNNTRFMLHRDTSDNYWNHNSYLNIAKIISKNGNFGNEAAWSIGIIEHSYAE